MFIFNYQPALRPALPCVYGTFDYREQRALFERTDLILCCSGLEQEFIKLALTDRQINTEKTSAKFLGRFARLSVLALRSNIARKLIGRIRTAGVEYACLQGSPGVRRYRSSPLE